MIYDLLLVTECPVEEVSWVVIVVTSEARRTRLRSDNNEEVDHEDLLEKFRASERAKRLNKRPAGLYRFRNQQIAEVIYGVVPDEQKRSTTGASPSFLRTVYASLKVGSASRTSTSDEPSTPSLPL